MLVPIIGASLSEPHSSEDSSNFVLDHPCIRPAYPQSFNGNNCVFYIPNLASPRSRVNMAWDQVLIILAGTEGNRNC